MKTKFNELLRGAEIAQNGAVMTREQYFDKIEEIKKAKEREAVKMRLPKDYYNARHYEVLIIQGTSKLIYPLSEGKEIRYYVYKCELFEILHDCHISIGHGGRDKMVKE